MKRKIGELRNIPIVEGDKNLVRGGAEIHINDLQTNGSSFVNSSKYIPKYYAIDWDKCSDSWKYILSAIYSMEDDISSYLGLAFISTVKIHAGEACMIVGSCMYHIEYIKAFSYLPVSMCDKLQEGYEVQYQMPFNINDLIEFLNTFFSKQNKEPISMEGITEITEEEYYKMD